jgi:hypothetical protein
MGQAELLIAVQDYAPRTAETQAWWEAQNGQQGGDAPRLAQALLTIAGQEQPRRRFVAGAIGIAEQKAVDLRFQLDAWRDLSTSLAIDEADTTAGRASA